MREPPRDRGQRLPETAETLSALATLTELLWCERDTLEHLLFALVGQRLILESGQIRWLRRAHAEVGAAMELAQNYEVARAAELEALVLPHGLPAGTSLQELADIAPQPWSLMLHEHREALRMMLAEIDVVAAANRDLLELGAQASQDALAQLAATTVESG